MSGEQVLGVSAPNSNTNQGSDHVAQLVGEGKKFKTIEDLAKGKIESDNFVKQLQDENKALREIAAGRAEERNTTLLSDMVAALAKQGNTNSTPTTTTTNQQSQPGLTEESVNALIDRRDADRTAASNVSAFNSAMTKTFGDKAETEIRTRLQTLGIDPQHFAATVAKSPKAAFAMLSIGTTGGTAGELGSREGSVNTEALNANNPNGSVKNYAYFRELRKKLGTRYYDPAIQQDLFKQRKEQGEKFYQ